MTEELIIVGVLSEREFDASFSIKDLKKCLFDHL